MAVRRSAAVSCIVVLCCLAAVPAEAQPSCTYTISLTGDPGDLGDSTVLDYISSGGSSQIRVITSPECPWTAESSASIVTLPFTSGVGTRDVPFSVAVNFTPTDRSAIIRIADQSVEVTQGRGTPIVDFNRDGYFDLLWHNRADGRLSTWLMNGSQPSMGVLFTNSPVAETNWELVGSGDLDADGHSDLVWRNNADGRISAWLMSGLQKIDGSLLSIPQVSDLDWGVRAISDADGDGRADIFWQHQTQGLVAVWRMNGFTVLDGSLVDAPVITDPGWHLVGVSGEQRGNELTLHWQHHGDGRLAVWIVSQMKLVLGGVTGASVADTNWKIRAMGDLNRDGVSDYIWRHEVDGRLAAWLDRRGTNTVDLPAVTDTNWQLVGPR